MKGKGTFITINIHPIEYISGHICLSGQKITEEKALALSYHWPMIMTLLSLRLGTLNARPSS